MDYALINREHIESDFKNSDPDTGSAISSSDSGKKENKLGVFFDRQPASRVIKIQNLQWLGTGTLATTNFTAETYQIRICSQIPIWFSVDNSTGSGPLLSSLPTTAGGVGTFLPNSTVGGEYFTVSPGQIMTVSSTSSSTAGAGNYISIQEMA